LIPRTVNVTLQLFLMANFYRVNGPIGMRLWKGRLFENNRKLYGDSIYIFKWLNILVRIYIYIYIYIYV
jgi:hypothetical protein